mgnify:CR=1 FL=1
MTITLAAVKQHIRKCKRLDRRFNWLGFVENADLTPEVEALFTFYDLRGHPAYDWVKSNARLQQLEREATP